MDRIIDLHMKLIDISNGKFKVFDSLTYEQKQNTEAMLKLCKHNKYGLLFVDKSLQENPEFLTTVTDDCKFTFWLYEKVKNSKLEKINALKRIAKDFMFFFDLESSILDDHIFVNASRDLVTYGLQLKKYDEETKEMILKLFNQKLELAKKENNLIMKEESKLLPDNLDKQRINKITDLLLEIGAPSHLSGFNLMKEAILFETKSKDKENLIDSKSLYKLICNNRNENITPDSIHRNLRYLVSEIEKENSGKIFNKVFKGDYFGPNGKTPKLRLFISLMAEKVLADEKNNNRTK